LKNMTYRFSSVALTPIPDPDCLGRHFVDQFWCIPKSTDLTIEEVIRYCNVHSIDTIIPTRDGELSFFARHREQLGETNIFALVSQLQGVETCLDKLAFSQAFPDISIPTSTDISQLSCASYVVKERFGAGSRSTLLNAARIEAQQYAEQLQAPVFQPWIEGKEYSVDLYLTRSGQPLGAIARSRDLIVDGEARISTTVNNPVLEETCLTLAQKLKLSGHLVIQAIIDSDNRIHIVECNARFGGASTLSLSAGLNSPLWLFCEATGIDPTSFPFRRSPGKLRQVRHAADTLIEMPGDADG